MKKNVMRINQFLAKSLGISRRSADELIESRRVKIDGVHAEFHNKVDENVKVTLLDNNEWGEIKSVDKNETVLFYKPIFTITAKKEQFDRRTIYDSVPPRYHKLKPAGRLDYMSEGLLVMSNDGELLQKLTHPKHKHVKVYLVGLMKRLLSKEIEELQKGITVDDYKLNTVEIEKMTKGSMEKYDYLKLQEKLQWYQFTLTEGRNNQIRKMCEYAEQKVQRLIRIKHGEYEMSEDLRTKKVIKID